MEYREVKASEKLPDKIGYYFTTTIHEKQGVVYWDGSFWWDDPAQDGKLAFRIRTEYIPTWLEPIQGQSAQERYDKASALALKAIRGGKLEIFGADRNILNVLLEIASGLTQKEEK